MENVRDVRQDHLNSLEREDIHKIIDITFSEPPWLFYHFPGENCQKPVLQV